MSIRFTSSSGYLCCKAIGWVETSLEARSFEEGVRRELAGRQEQQIGLSVLNELPCHVTLSAAKDCLPLLLCGSTFSAPSGVQIQR